MKGFMFTVRWNMILSISESSDVEVTCVLVCHFLLSCGMHFYMKENLFNFVEGLHFAVYIQNVL